MTQKGYTVGSELYRGVDSEPPHHASLTEAAREYIATLGITDLDADDKRAGTLWMHALAVGHSTSYLDENEGGLRNDYPRIPLPAARKDLLASAELGRKIAALLDPEAPVDGVTAGKVWPELKKIGIATKAGGGQLAGADFAVTARWGSAGKGGVTMPSTGKKDERAFAADEATALGDAATLLGPDTLDIYLNDKAHWKNVPRRVWEYTLGGYQVLKKWLSYREESILRRPLTVDEVGYVTDVTRRIAALLLLGPELDVNYERIKAATYNWA